MAKKQPAASNGANAREAARQARSSMQAAEKKRERLIRLAAVLVVAVVVAAIVVAVMVSRSGRPSFDPDPTAAVPKGVDAATAAVHVGDAPETAPVFELWFDFMCPACQQYDLAAGEMLDEAAEAGQMQLLMRPTTFMDERARSDASKLALNSYGCALDAGVGGEYQRALYLQQGNYSNDVFIQTAQDVGMTGETLSTFTSCVEELTYSGWVGNALQQFNDSEIGSTPSIVLNGNVVESRPVSANDLSALLASVS